MGRGVTKIAFECADLAQTWMVASEDPILGIDQTSHSFNTGMFDRFKSMKPITASPKQYARRGLRSTRAKWDVIARDCPKFRSSLRFIRAFNPTEVSEDQIISMAIAKHLGKPKYHELRSKRLSA